MNSIIETYFKATLYVSFFVLMGLLIYLIFEEKPGQFTALLAASLVMVAARLKDLVRFRLGRDGLEADLDKIRTGLVEIHNISELFGKIALQQMQGAGRWGGYSQQALSQMRSNIVNGLRRIDMDNQRIIEVLAVEDPYFHFDYANRVMRAAQHRVSDDLQDEWRAFVELHNSGIGSEADPVEIRIVLSKLEILDGELMEAQLDYETFHQKRTHRRPAIFGYCYA